jgi:hypothetical protein
MFWKRKPKRKNPHERASHTDDHIGPLSVPGYGPPPVTKPRGAGPQPSTYGLPPDIDERPKEH